MHDAGLNHRQRPGPGDRFGEPGQPVTADDQNVLDAAVGQLSAHRRPELGALGGLDPDPQDVLDPVHVDPDRDMRGPVRHMRAVADLHDQRVEVDHRVERLQRPVLPCQDFLGDRLGDVADRLVGQVSAQRGREMVLDVSHRHPAGVQRDDHVLQPTQPAGALGHQRRPERAVPVSRLVQRDIPDLGPHRLRRGPVAGVARPIPDPVALLVTQVIGQLRRHPSLQDGLDHLGQEPARTSQRDTTLIGRRHQLIQHLVGEHLTTQPASLRLLLHVPLVRSHAHSQTPSRDLTTYTDHLTPLNRPGKSGDSDRWEGWSHARRHAQAVPA